MGEGWFFLRVKKLMLGFEIVKVGFERDVEREIVKMELVLSEGLKRRKKRDHMFCDVLDVCGTFIKAEMLFIHQSLHLHRMYGRHYSCTDDTVHVRTTTIHVRTNTIHV